MPRAGGNVSFSGSADLLRRQIGRSARCVLGLELAGVVRSSSGLRPGWRFYR